MPVCFPEDTEELIREMLAKPGNKGNNNILLSVAFN